MDKQRKFPIYVILENIRSAFNVGAIFRTSDAVGIKKLYLTGITPYPPHNKIPKTALGATKTVKWKYEKNIYNVIEKLKKQNVKVIGVEITPNAQIYTDTHYENPVALILGNEIHGIESKTLNLCDKIVKIPMFGSKKSLNVEVSYAIVVYEIIRQYLNEK